MLRTWRWEEESRNLLIWVLKYLEMIRDRTEEDDQIQSWVSLHNSIIYHVQTTNRSTVLCNFHLHLFPFTILWTPFSPSVNKSHSSTFTSGTKNHFRSPGNIFTLMKKNNNIYFQSDCVCSDNKKWLHSIWFDLIKFDLLLFDLFRSSLQKSNKENDEKVKKESKSKMKKTSTGSAAFVVGKFGF